MGVVKVRGEGITVRGGGGDWGRRELWLGVEGVTVRGGGSQGKGWRGLR